MNKIHADIARFMQGRIQRLVHSKAALAQLRRGIGKELGELPGLLGFVLPAEEITSWHEGEAMIERAIYTSITLYAFHQQGNDNCVSSGLDDEDQSISSRNSFGHAIRSLARKKGNEEAVLRRFNKVLSAKDLMELAIHARGLIGLLRKEKISLDYPSFAIDLYWFQQPDTRRSTLLKWGKDYYMNQREEDAS